MAGSLTDSSSLTVQEMSQFPSRDWTVLPIGGSSATGKTHLAHRRMHHFGVSTLEIDDLRLAMLQVARRDVDASLFAWEPPEGVSMDEYVASGDEKTLVERYTAVASGLWPGLRIVIGSHLATHTPVIIEGDGLLTELLEAHGHDVRVRVLFLVDEEERLFERQTARRRGGGRRAPRHRAFARLAHRFGQIVAARARDLGYPVLTAHPVETLEARAIKALEAPSAPSP